jgi:ribosomal protein S24E
LEIISRTDSKLLNRTEVEVRIRGEAGKISRKEALSLVAEEMKVAPAKVGLVRMEQQSGSRDIVGTFFIYGSDETMKEFHPDHLSVRMLNKGEREKLKQERKKAAAPKPEAK